MSLDSQSRELSYCTYCPKLCRFSCPTAEVEHHETVTPWAKMSLAEMVRAKRFQPDEDIGEVFYHCFGCLHCRDYCRHGNDVPRSLLLARGLNIDAKREPPAVRNVLNCFQTTGNSFGLNLSKRLENLVAKKYFVPEAQAVMFVGCELLQQRNSFLPDILSLLHVVGIDYLAVFHGSELCCGAPLWQLGQKNAFRQHARKVASALKRYRTVICPCPTCVYVLKALYAENDLAMKNSVIHISELLHTALNARSPKRSVPGSFVFHDPCTLSRYLGLSETPRKLLEPVLEKKLLESSWSQHDTFCCGGGGLVHQVLPHLSKATAEQRMEQLRATGADQIITACPGCVRHLRSVSKGLPVWDITQLLLKAYGDEPQPREERKGG